MRLAEATPLHDAGRIYAHGIRANLDQFVQQIIQVFFVGLVIGMERNVLPALATRDFGVAPGSFFFLLTFVLSFGLVKGALNFVAGTLADRFGRKGVLVVGWLAGLPIPILILYAPNWWWIVAANALLGINQGFAWSMTVTSKVDITRPEQRGFATGVNECAGYVAVGLAGVITGYFSTHYGPRLTLFGFGLVVVALGLLMAITLVRETLPWARAEHSKQKNGHFTGPLPRFPTGISAHPGTWEIFTLVSFRHPTFRALAQAGVTNKVADTLVWAILPIFLREHGLGIVAIGWVTGTYAMVWGLSQLGTGLLSDRIGRKPVIVTGLWALAVGIAGIALTGNIDAWVAWAAIMGVGMALLYPNLIAAVADISAPSWRGRALGAYRYWRDTGYAIGAIVLGATAQWTHDVLPAFWGTTVLLVVSGMWVALGASETHPHINPA
ncbi:MAG: MFS transporter [Betaproteobacteria bacterium]|nr:MFS transporter [Betaproteobacteria bacterium]